MSDFRHAIVWIDHSEATVARFRGPEESDVEIHSHTSLQRLHHLRTGWEAGGNSLPDTEFYQRVVGALEPNSDVLITGPGSAKWGFKSYVDLHRPQVSVRMVELDHSDAPATAELRELWRHYFAGDAQIQPPGDGGGSSRAPHTAAQVR
jgi:stalled ribosome rescue protein Dom34